MSASWLALDFDDNVGELVVESVLEQAATVTPHMVAITKNSIERKANSRRNDV